ncbi:hypothetical protein SAMN02910432_02052 [Ligilactobacillus ruminis DSM 20403 = NBRC 102161]|uniref:Uncharacterized protein n=1 Tax=Ligilactobacillus ruminis DSM 20403 = NBRC 102161 TaxID=1423798 RepID=A0A1I2TH47_9LACO|nr:hypothetical protein SAMN02910432_02052 [Ligilactobacillus ruminis DSM 20403 = NBRC 102161]
MESEVEHFFNFGEFCSTFEPARPEFGPASRQKSHIHYVFCLLLVPRTPIQTYGRDYAKARDFETMFDAGVSAF